MWSPSPACATRSSGAWPRRSQAQSRPAAVVAREGPVRHAPRYEKLVGDLSGAYSRRINIQHRLVYQVVEDKKVVKVLRMWSHYE
ncbi:MAG: Txe/YoeB family addiction module toxin [Anaerosomatales bacterium]|nr:Txe/YoeB family addiction module toxin [Anaerosomatales bacterium]